MAAAQTPLRPAVCECMGRQRRRRAQAAGAGSRSSAEIGHTPVLGNENCTLGSAQEKRGTAALITATRRRAESS
jgi:hypothetical protein